MPPNNSSKYRIRLNFVVVALALARLTGVSRADEMLDAAQAGDLKTVTAVAARQPEAINTRDARGLTPLHLAASGKIAVVKFLLAHQAAVNARSKNGSTPLYVAARFGQTEIARLLIEAGANLNAGADGETPLHQAVYRSPIELGKLLIEHGVDVTARNREGATALHVAATWNSTALFPLLLAHHADLNAPDRKGDTPLHATLDFGSGESEGSIEAAELLISAKADLHLKNKAGKTALALAREKKCSKLAKLIEDAGGTE